MTTSSSAVYPFADPPRPPPPPPPPTTTTTTFQPSRTGHSPISSRLLHRWEVSLRLRPRPRRPAAATPRRHCLGSSTHRFLVPYSLNLREAILTATEVKFHLKGVFENQGLITSVFNYLKPFAFRAMCQNRETVSSCEGVLTSWKGILDWTGRSPYLYYPRRRPSW